MSKRSKTIQRDPSGREVSTYEEEEDDDVLKDGQSLRVSLLMMDGSPNPKLDATQRAVGTDAPTSKLLVGDGSDNTLNLHKPGFRYSTNAAERTAADAALTEAYEARELADREAWRSSDDHPLNTNARSLSRGQHEGDSCSIDGQRDRQQHAQMVADAYAEYDREAENAWRK